MVSAEVSRVDAPARRDRILDIVAELLETEGYDAVQLREVARRARTSLATIYKRYSTRDELILAALQSWMDEQPILRVCHANSRTRRIRSTSAMMRCSAHHLRAVGAAPRDADGLLSREGRTGRAGTLASRSRHHRSVLHARYSPTSTTNSSPTSTPSSPAWSTDCWVDSRPARSPSPRSCPSSTAPSTGSPKATNPLERPDAPQ